MTVHDHQYNLKLLIKTARKLHMPDTSRIHFGREVIRWSWPNNITDSIKHIHEIIPVYIVKEPAE